MEGSGEGLNLSRRCETCSLSNSYLKTQTRSNRQTQTQWKLALLIWKIVGIPLTKISKTFICPSDRRWRSSVPFFMWCVWLLIPNPEAQTRPHTAHADPCHLVGGGQGRINHWANAQGFALE